MGRTQYFPGKKLVSGEGADPYSIGADHRQPSLHEGRIEMLLALRLKKHGIIFINLLLEPGGAARGNFAS